MKIEYNPVYSKAFEFQGRFLKLVGGAGSGKSCFAASKLIKRVLEEKPHRFLLLRKVHRTIKRSQYQLIKDNISDYGLSKIFKINESEYSFHCKNGNEIISCGLDDREKLKSIQGITGIWIEEATELTAEDFSQVNLRLRGKLSNYKQIILTFNPIDHAHWLNKLNFEENKINKDTGKLEPYFMELHTTHRDNKFIDEEYREELENLKGQDINMYNIYALGLWGQRLETIYKPYKIINEFPSEFEETYYGLDFGYNVPSALVQVNRIDTRKYLREMLYRTKMTNKDIIDFLIAEKISPTDCIYADNAEPDRIEEIKRAGFNIFPADKSVKAGIDYCKSQEYYSLPENANLNKENSSYSYKKDKDGNVLDEPVKFNDHAMDAKRYAEFTHSKIGNIVPNIFVIG